MKALKQLTWIILLVGLISCEKDETTTKIDVGTYIGLLKSDQYEALSLPSFTDKDIPALLTYIDDNSLVSRFPHNLASSYAPPSKNYQVGILVLWTIESIRTTSNNNENSLFGFPSQHPFIQTRHEPIELITDHTDEAYTTVRQAYSRWWEENKQKKFSSFCNIDPLEDTGYKWY